MNVPKNEGPKCVGSQNIIILAAGTPQRKGEPFASLRHHPLAGCE